MNFTSFFAEVLGAKLNNPLWSWGATDSLGRVFLRVWDDRIDRRLNRVEIALDKPRRKSSGYPERLKHIASIRNGAGAFGVVCKAIDPKTSGKRTIASFDDSELLRFGKLMKVDGGRTLAQIDERVAVEDVVRERNTIEDIRAIERRKDIPVTTRASLTLARVGQGTFRSTVLRLWGQRCAVTGATTQSAIRASHIKPWRDSSDAERLDPHNGIPLVATLDALFDVGLISFRTSGEMIVSKKLNAAERAIFGVASAALKQTPNAKTADYLAHHRRKHRFDT